MKNDRINNVGENNVVLMKKQEKQIMRNFMEDNDDRFKELWFYRKI